MTPVPTLSIVVSTIGREEPLRRLMQSVHNTAQGNDIEFVVVDQSPDQRCLAVARERDWAMTVRTATSGRGASVGRNVGLQLSTAPIVLFPDDDAWYPPAAFDAIINVFATDPEAAAVCGRQTTADGRPSMLRWQRDPGAVTARNFLRTSIMSTMFFRRGWLDRVGPFDEDMGVGTSTWWGACEESDLLLRVIEAGGPVRYRPDLQVFQDDPRDAPDAAFVEKMLRYGCGQGHLWRKRRLSKTLLAYLLARKLAAALVRSARGNPVLARADLAWLRGNVAGLFDRMPRALRT